MSRTASEDAPQWRGQATAGTSPMTTVLNVSHPAVSLLPGPGEESQGSAAKPRGDDRVTFRPETAVRCRRALMLTSVGDAGHRSAAAAADPA